MANPKKCTVGQVEIQYLGFHLSLQQVHPQIDKKAAIAACLRPKNKNEVRQFLGLLAIIQGMDNETDNEIPSFRPQ